MWKLRLTPVKRSWFYAVSWTELSVMITVSDSSRLVQLTSTGNGWLFRVCGTQMCAKQCRGLPSCRGVQTKEMISKTQQAILHYLLFDLHTRIICLAVICSVPASNSRAASTLLTLPLSAYELSWASVTQSVSLDQCWVICYGWRREEKEGHIMSDNWEHYRIKRSLGPYNITICAKNQEWWEELWKTVMAQKPSARDL